MADAEDTSDLFEGLYASPCGYFKERTAHEAVFQLPTLSESLTLATQQNKRLADALSPQVCQQIIFDSLLSEGFRRANDLVYCAVCPDCKKCNAIRIAAENFIPTKTQRHTYRANEDVELTVVSDPEQFVTAEKITLYGAYEKRHNPDSNKTAAEYRNELVNMNGVVIPAHKENGTDVSVSASYSGTVNMEYRLKKQDGSSRLIGVGIVDVATDSLSSNYFYYDISPDILKRSIGVFSVLKEIEWCRSIHRTWYYLGYWISDCKKMNYKANYKPHQLLQDGEWKDDTGATP